MHTAVRISWNKWTKKEELNRALDKIKKEVKRLREISVLWDE